MYDTRQEEDRNKKGRRKKKEETEGRKITERTTNLSIPYSKRTKKP